MNELRAQLQIEQIITHQERGKVEPAVETDPIQFEEGNPIKVVQI